MRRLGPQRHLSHGTIVAYVALFFALGGTGWAASHVSSGPTLVARVAGGSGVKVHCSATRNGKRVSCRVLRGSGVGPRGPRGPQGPPGNSGSSGGSGGTDADSFTESPAYNLTTPVAYVNGVGVNAQSSDTTNDEWQQANIFTFKRWTTADPGTITFRTPLLSPNQLQGTGAHLDSVDFCYGLQNTNQYSNGEADVSITNATVLEYVEPDGTSTSGYQPAYTPVTLIDKPLTLTTSDAGGSTGCDTVTASPAAAITSGGYLELDVQVQILTPTAPISPGTASYQGWVDFGRVTTTYAP